MIINGYTAEYMQEILNGNIVSGAINGAGHLMLVRRDGTQLDAGYFGLSANIITVATDFRTLTTPGAYLFQSSVLVGQCTNAPVASGYGFSSAQAGFLLVEGDGNLFVKQTWLNYNDPSSLLIQTKYVNGGTTTWYPWAPPVKSTSTTRSGLIQLATAAEAAAETDGTHAVTPALLASQKGFRLLQVVAFESSGTFTKASYPGMRAARVRTIGGGGGGGGANAAGAGVHSVGGGGGGGGYAETLLAASSLGTTETVTVGAGGSAGIVGGNGGTGGASSFGALVASSGGSGGGILSGNSGYVSAVGGAGGSGTTGTLKTSGSPGGYGTGNATLAIGGLGGSSLYGGGGVGSVSTAAAAVAGSAGSGYGGGGSGALVNQNASGTTGGAGAAGLVFVEVYV